MTAAWQLALAELRCDVAWRDGQLYWQIGHPDAPGGQTHPAPISDINLDRQPVQWTTLVGVAENNGPDGAPHLQVTLEDSSGRLRLTRHFELFRGHPFVRTWGTVERIGVDDGPAPLLDGAAILHPIR
jgi:hypothetical protein